jgi:23S rRNA pseudouridine2605 synthase/23S rRNA pseudouridine2604 synthase
MAELVRLNKYIAGLSAYSRREVDVLMGAGKVLLNGQRVVELGTKIDPAVVPTITVRGQTLHTKPKHFTYVALNKPDGYVVTKAEFKTEHSVMELLPASLEYLKPIGRLDKHSTGLLILTNDGDCIQTMTHPSFQHDKEYIARTKYPISPADLRAFAEGVRLEEGTTGKAKVQLLDDKRVKIILRQGWNRQIRRMVEARQNKVLGLQRIRVGQFSLGTLPLGQWKIIKRTDLYD